MIAALAPKKAAAQRSTWVNDVHSGLNRTRVGNVLKPASEGELIQQVGIQLQRGRTISVSGGRHAMGGQQFVRGGICLDLRGCNRIISLNQERGVLEVEAGIQWPELIQGYLTLQKDILQPWGIIQKQTGADGFTIGGSLGANIHGRGLGLKPFVDDIESFQIIRADGIPVTCSRHENCDLFRLAIGGYGLIGAITRVAFRLRRRVPMERRVELIHARDLIGRLSERIDEGDRYGDFQFSIDEKSPDFLQWGVLAGYRPCEDQGGRAEPTRGLNSEQWIALLRLAYTDRAEGFRRYAAHYLSTHGQVYWSDLHQLSPYLPDYQHQINRLTERSHQSSLMISELYVPRQDLADFLEKAAAYLRKAGPPVIYGTVRLIEAESETFLAWARKPWACVIFNLLTEHTSEGIAHSQKTFRYLIDLAISMGGTYYLTYHRWAGKDQVETCHPNLRKFLEKKRQQDPEERFQSDWYRYYRSMFSPDLKSLSSKNS